MKILVALLLTSIFLNTASAQAAIRNVVPDKIAGAFQLKYPACKARKWKFKNDIYSVTFIADHKKNISNFDSDGVWRSTETLISSTGKLPRTIKSSFIKSEFAAWYIESIEKFELPQSTCYKFFINNGSLLDGDHHDAFLKKYLLELSTDGKLIRKTTLD